MTTSPADVFDTAAIRARVLAAWAAAPARFREDANAEEDLALGGYRDRVVVELAQNAADAAARAGVPGRLRLTLRDGVLVAANTGALLDAAGAESLATLRASAKRDDGSSASGGRAAVGRFGVGFAAVLAVTDSPAVVSRSGGVRWSLPDARALAAQVAQQAPGLADELLRRSGAVPVLRLPFPAEGSPPEGYDTAVIVPLRDTVAEELTQRLLAEIDDALLLALPALAEVVVEAAGVDGVRRVLTARRQGSDVLVGDAARQSRWRLAAASGVLDRALLAGRPTEERAHPAWSVTWAVPVDSAGVPVQLPPDTPPVVHAPTPTDEPLGLPALLLASFPLDPTRRHVAPGPLRDFLVARAGETYAELLAGLPPHPALLTLVPGPAGQGELDARIRRAVLARLPETAFLAVAEQATEPADRPGPVRLRPRDAIAVERADAALVEVLGPALPGLLPAGWDRYRGALAATGVRLMPLAEVIDLLAGVERPPSWWRRFYAALVAVDVAGVGRDALAGLPVPLADGRQVTGPRGVLLPVPGLGAEALHALGLRVVHPEAAHPLLERLGAVPATPRAVLAEPAVRAAVAESYESDDPEALADAVLAVVAAASPAPGEEPWLAELTLPVVDDGGYAPAGELMLPDSPIAAVVEPGELDLVDPELVARWGPDVLAAVGVLRTFGVVRDTDLVLDLEACDHDLDGEDDWLRDSLAALPGSDVPPLVPELLAVRDLDLVADAAWPEALRMLAVPPLRAAVTEPVRVVLPGGTARRVPSYTAWWLRSRPVLGGRPPAGLRAAGSDPLLAGLYDEADTELDPEFLRALGVRTTLAALLAEPGGAAELLDRLADPARTVDRARLGRIYRALAEAAEDLPRQPDRLRALVGDRVEVVAAADAVVVDAPCLLPLLGDRPRLPVPPSLAARLADLLDLPLAGELTDGSVQGEGVRCAVPAVVRELLPEAPAEYLEHDTLLVDGIDVDWWFDGADAGAGAVSLPRAATLDGLAHAVAWAAGRWERRFEVEAVLADPDRADELRTEQEFEDSAR